MTIPSFALIVAPFADTIELAGADQPDSKDTPHFLYALNPSTESARVVFPDSSAYTVAAETGSLLFVENNEYSLLLGPFSLSEEV